MIDNPRGAVTPTGTAPAHVVCFQGWCLMVDLLRSVEQSQLKDELLDVRLGDTVRVHNRIVEGDQERVQAFEGTVIRVRKRGSKANFTVRRIAVHGIGVERTFLFHSPRVERVDVLRRAHVRRANLYFLRERRGRKARLREKRF